NPTPPSRARKRCWKDELGDGRGSSRAELLHRALNQLLGVVELFEHEPDVHSRFAGKALAAAVHPVLAHERERIGEQIERDRQAPTRGPHHRFVTLERVAVLIEYRHSCLGPAIAGPYGLRGLEGRSSTRLGKLRRSWRRRLRTTSATSSGAIFQSAPMDWSPPRPKAVATDPGMT